MAEHCGHVGADSLRPTPHERLGLSVDLDDLVKSLQCCAGRTGQCLHAKPAHGGGDRAYRWRKPATIILRVGESADRLAYESACQASLAVSRIETKNDVKIGLCTREIMQALANDGAQDAHVHWWVRDVPPWRERGLRLAITAWVGAGASIADGDARDLERLVEVVGVCRERILRVAEGGLH